MDKSNALERKKSLVEQIVGKKIALFLDYDGTLTPIVSQPDLAVLDPSMKEILEKLARSAMTVAIISGRDKEDVIQKVQVEGLYYSGSHGFDTSGPNGFYYEYEGGKHSLSALADAERILRQKLAEIKGVLVEKKKYAIAIHYRLADPDQISTIEAAVDAVLLETKGLKKTGGKMIFELRPDISWNKGKAVEWILQVLNLDHEGVVPIYIGDDETDEDAFVALKGCGIGVVVQDKPAPTAASFTLRDTSEVREFLEFLNRQL